MAHVTDYDVWHETEAPVTVEMVIRQLLANADVAKQAVVNAVVSLRDAPPSPYAGALKDAIITHPSAIPADLKKRLALLLDTRVSARASTTSLACVRSWQDGHFV